MTKTTKNTKHITTTLILAIITISLAACQAEEPNPNNNYTLYQAAIEDAKTPCTNEIDSLLIAITPSNQDLIWKTIENQNHLLVATWCQDITHYTPYLEGGYYNTGTHDIWVTTAPELQQRMHLETNTKLRLQQLLGLPPNADYTHFVLFWVKPQDLYRPCADSEINDQQCQLYFPPNTDSTHIQWIYNNRTSSYNQSQLYNQYPWTQLGYTYDWHPDNTTHRGLSEFIISTNTNILVQAIYTTQQYLTE